MLARTLSIAAAVVLALSAGCSTYVNIPPIEGDVAAHDTNESSVRQLMAAAGAAVLQERPIPGKFVVVLPRGTRPETYDYVLPRISSNAVWSSGGPTGDEPTIEIRQIRIRGSNAEADVIRPLVAGEPGTTRQLVTVDLEWNFFEPHWLVQQVRVWHTSVDRALQTGPGVNSGAEVWGREGPTAPPVPPEVPEAEMPK